MLTSACKSDEKRLIVACLISPVILFVKLRTQYFMRKLYQKHRSW